MKKLSVTEDENYCVSSTEIILEGSDACRQLPDNSPIRLRCVRQVGEGVGGLGPESIHITVGWRLQPGKCKAMNKRG